MATEAKHKAFSTGRRLLLLGGAGLLWPAAGNAATLSHMKLSQDGGITRLTLDGVVTWHLTAQATPPALLLELPRTVWRGPASLPGCGSVSHVRASSGRQATRLTLLLTGPIATPRLRQQDRVLVLELRPGAGPAFAGMAAAGRLAESTRPADRPAARQTASLPLVMLDPGHGGHDPGAIGAGGTQEKRITLAVAHELKRQLEAAGRCRVGLTRSRNVFVSLADRVAMARRQQAALLLSLHADSVPAESARLAHGASVYTLGQTASDPLAAALARRENLADQAGGRSMRAMPPEVLSILFSLMRQETRTGSEYLATQLVAALDDKVAMLPNSHRRAGFAVLKAPDVPAALVELGFLSHRRDEAALSQPAHRAKLAAALTQAVHGFLAHQHMATGEPRRAS